MLQTVGGKGERAKFSRLAQFGVCVRYAENADEKQEQEREREWDESGSTAGKSWGFLRFVFEFYLSFLRRDTVPPSEVCE